MQPFNAQKDAQEPHSVSGEVLLGVTVGGYVILAIALYCFGQGLVPVYPNDTPPFVPYFEDPGTLICLAPALLIGGLSYAQAIAERSGRSSYPRATRVALWLNALASVGFCLLVALRRPPDIGRVPADDYFQIAVLAATLAAFVLGLLMSLFNFLSGFIRQKNPA